MKKLIYPLLAVSIIFAACKKEDEPTGNNTETSASIVGTWEITNTNIEEEEIINDITVLDTSYTVTELNGQSKLQFHTGGTWNEYSQNDSLISTGNWELYENSLTVDSDTESINSNLVSISNTDFILETYEATVQGSLTTIILRTTTYGRIDDIINP
jgi:hypothetical protein